MRKYLLLIGLLISINCSASEVDCYINTPNQFSLHGEVKLVTNDLYRVVQEDNSIIYVPVKDCVVFGIVIDP